MVEVNMIDISNPICEKNYNKYLNRYIDVNKIAKFKRFRKKQDAIQGLYGELLARWMLSEKLHGSIDNIKLSYTDYGKPYFDNEQNFHFNYSHSGIYTVCALSQGVVGADIERIRDIDFTVAKKLCSTEELQLFNNLNDNEKKDYFYNLWTLKESYIKCDGRGMSIPFNSFSINFFDSDTIKLIPDSNNLYRFKQYEMDDAYKLSVCSSEHQFKDRLEIVNDAVFTSLEREGGA